MVRYHIVWEPKVLDELALVWMSAANRNVISGAADAIKNALRLSPRSKGTDLGDGLYSFAIDPLYVLLEVVDEDNFVRILGFA